MDLSDYYMDNPAEYSALFREHAKKISALMRIIDEEIIAVNLPPVGRSKELFRMVNDLSYQVDRAYKREHNIKEELYTTFLSSDNLKEELKAEMKTLLAEEFTRFLEIQNDNK